MALEEAKREQEYKTSIQKRLAALASSKVGLLISEPFVTRLQKRIQNLVKYLRWGFLQKQLLSQNASSQTFDRVLNTLVALIKYVYSKKSLVQVFVSLFLQCVKKCQESFKKYVTREGGKSDKVKGLQPKKVMSFTPKFSVPIFSRNLFLLLCFSYSIIVSNNKNTSKRLSDRLRQLYHHIYRITILLFCHYDLLICVCLCVKINSRIAMTFSTSFGIVYV